MTSNPKKHIIDSLLREIYGGKTPPDQTDEIMRRLGSGDSSLLSENRSIEVEPVIVHKDSGQFPSVTSDQNTRMKPLRWAKSNWIAVAASVVFCVGLIGAMVRVLGPDQNLNQFAKQNGKESASESSTESLKPSGVLATRPTENRAEQSLGPTGEVELANSGDPKSNKGTGSSVPQGTNQPLENNPLQMFAANVPRKELVDLKAIVDQSFANNWHVNLIESTNQIDKATWLKRTFSKTLGREPEAADLHDLRQYVAGEEFPSFENQLRVVESIMFDDSTRREFSNFWADKFLIHLTQYLPKSKDSEQAKTALKKYLRQAFISNEPLDVLVKKMIEANGSIDSQAVEFDGAAGFIASAGDRPNLIAENISRTLLGTELTCAKCHSDIVYEQSRQDYLGLAAFIQGTKVTKKTTGIPVVSDQATSRKVPGLFFSNRSGQLIYADPMIAGHDANLDQQAARSSLAQQLIQSDRFAKAMVNWIWSEVYGYGLARDGRISQSHNAPHQSLLSELAEQLVANKFDFRIALKWTLLAKPFAGDSKPDPNTLTKDIPKYGGVPFFSYAYEQVEHDPRESVNRLAKAYQQPNGLSSMGRLSLNVKQTGKGLEIIDQMENGLLPGGLQIDDEIPDFAKGWGVESTRVEALDRIAASTALTRKQKINHLYLLALHRMPSNAEFSQARKLFEIKSESEKGSQKSEEEILQDLWWAIYPR